MLNLGVFGDSNTWIILKEEVEVEVMFDITKPRRAIGPTLDDAAEFRNVLEEMLEARVTL